MKQKLLLLFVLVYLSVQGQNQLSYIYDNSGNRICKTVVLLSRTIENDAEEQIPELFEDKIGSVQVKIYPNPVKSILNVNILGLTDEMSSEYVLSNISGRLLERNNISNHEVEIDMNKYTTGNYVLQILLDGEKTGYIIIKE
ncbi:MAG: T9SS type A sorting domain-containing protein [Bacteroidales bacterium]